MKKLILTVVMVLAFFVPTAISQEGGHPPHGEGGHELEKKDPSEIAEERTKMMTEKLDLTEEQTEKVRELNLEHAKKMKQLHEEKKALHEKFKGAHDEMKASMEEVLNEEQKTKMKEFHQKRKERRNNQLPQCCKHCSKHE